MAKLEDLLTKRGYIKGSLTRLMAITEERDLGTYSTEMLIIKKQRVIAAFESYERVNEQIVCLSSDDKEGEYEHVQTARAYRLERDAKVEPKVDHFLTYLEKRALAMGNSEVSIALNRPSTAMKTINLTTKEKQGCIYCPNAIITHFAGDCKHLAAASCRATA